MELEDCERYTDRLKIDNNGVVDLGSPPIVWYNGKVEEKG